MLASSQLVAFVSTMDPQRSRRFYESTLGLRLVEETPFACVFDAAGTQLRVTRVGSLTPAPFTVLGWHVADVEAAVAALVDRSVAFFRYEGMVQDDLGIWTSPSGARIAWFHDPDGNVLSLTQL